jgi:hypothetical protein
MRLALTPGAAVRKDVAEVVVGNLLMKFILTSKWKGRWSGRKIPASLSQINPNHLLICPQTWWRAQEGALTMFHRPRNNHDRKMGSESVSKMQTRWYFNSSRVCLSSCIHGVEPSRKYSNLSVSWHMLPFVKVILTYSVQFSKQNSHFWTCGLGIWTYNHNSIIVRKRWIWGATVTVIRERVAQLKRFPK